MGAAVPDGVCPAAAVPLGARGGAAAAAAAPDAKAASGLSAAASTAAFVKPCLRWRCRRRFWVLDLLVTVAPQPASMQK